MVVVLHNARYFVLGYEELTVAVDHKPSLMLTNLKEKAMYFRFDTVWVLGKVPDANARVPKDKLESEQGEFAMIIAGLSTKGRFQ